MPAKVILLQALLCWTPEFRLTILQSLELALLMNGLQWLEKEQHPSERLLVSLVEHFLHQASQQRTSLGCDR